MDFAHDRHAFDYMSKGGKPLAVGVATPAEVECRLFADADKEFGATGCAEFTPCQRDRAVGVTDTGLRRAFVSNGGQGAFERSEAALDDLNFDGAPIVVHAHDAIESAAVVQARLDIA